MYIQKKKKKNYLYIKSLYLDIYIEKEKKNLYIKSLYLDMIYDI